MARTRRSATMPARPRPGPGLSRRRLCVTSGQQRPDAAAFERDMRARFVTRENLETLFRLVMPHLLPDRPSLVYILTQSDRIGHLTMEPQVLKTVYGDRYDRIIVLTPPMTRDRKSTRLNSSH